MVIAIICLDSGGHDAEDLGRDGILERTGCNRAVGLIGNSKPTSYSAT